ncbi:MAG: bifunctional diguanylate cyclase/phosphodiesterase, partial [Pseudomonadota bacterium]
AAKAYQDRLTYNDALTDLPNRRLFLDRFNDSLNRARRNGKAGAVLQIDLDRFRKLNDSLGYGQGDRVLRAIARRLSGCIRQADELSRGETGDDFASASRVGGNEFMIMLPTVEDEQAIDAVASRALAAISEPVATDDGEVIVTASIGVVRFPEQADSAEELLCNLALATSRAKLRGRNRYELYSAACASAAPDRMRLEADLHRALERDELRLYYQPKVCASSGRAVGSEALLRWQHGERGLVSPGEFIPLAEETGLIVPFGNWVIRTACEQLARWHRAGHSGLGVSVNVASLQLKDGALPGVVREALAQSGVDPALLTLELTESAVIENASHTIDALRGLKALGVKLSLDDFGTGYSSLSYLDRLPITELKIDRSFVQKVDRPGGDAPILSAVIAMGRHLGLNVVAEGVENEAQREFLARHACDVIQGFWYARPLPVDEFNDWLAAQAQS